MECTWLAITLAILDLSVVVVTVAERQATVLYSFIESEVAGDFCRQ